ncbi:MAG: tRNA lysidine(34) synthetase TilS [Candidatus Eisenbacteria bacterium]
MEIRTTFANTLSDKGLVRPGERILLALSGGPDSTALAYLFDEIRQERGLELRALHVNYGLRGRDSDEDERFVRGLESGLRMPLAVRSARGLVLRKGESLQMGARRVRYEALEEEAARVSADRIATGHTRDDRVETLLINLLRGAGARGLGAIPYRRGKLIRPLLDVSRGEIEAYLDRIGASYRVDRSNLETGYDRNRIRLELLPFAEKLMGRPVGEPLARTADILAEIESYLEHEAERWIERHAEDAEGETTVPAGALALLPRALARQAIRSLARRAAGSPEGIPFERVESVLSLSAGLSSGRVPLGEELEARREGDALRFGPPRGEAAPFLVPLPVPGDAALPDGSRVRCRALPPEENAGAPSRESGRVTLDAGRVRPPLVVRSRLPGDRFRPFGSPGERKLQDLLVDRKIPRSERSRIPLLADSEGILWVVGIAIADRAKISASTTSILEVAFCAPRDDTRDEVDR